ncbi:MAG TPA: OmpA family protein [Gemmatimonadales bacterium]|nr:OmpA family protein [Gemmatimonadales bacterium]
MNRSRACAAVLAFALFLLPAVAEAQLGGLSRRIRDKARERVEQKEEETAERVVDAADPATAGGAASADSAAPATGAAPATSAASGASATSQKPGEGAWVRYDFVPGERILFVDDFAKEQVGDFPRRVQFIEGNMETAEWQGGHWLRATSWPSKFAIELPETLPERFTVEFDVVTGRANAYVEIGFVEGDDHTKVYYREISGTIEGGVEGAGVRAYSRKEHEGGTPFRARIMADGKYVKVYVGETRVANVPTADLGRSNRIYFEFPALPDDPAFLTNVSIMAGGRDLYDALSAEGRVATQGIYFDTGSDRIRPESTPTLRQISTMLAEHPDLRLTIEGHTDNVGNAAANKTLSEKRAAAVSAYLVGAGIDASRLEAAGLGDTKPAAPNATPEGRQQNRRVELVKR